MLHAQIGLPGIGSLFGSLFDPFIAITAVTAAARAGLLPSAARLARAVSALSHEEPRSKSRSLRSLAQ
jgi:hypothetical protein